MTDILKLLRPQQWIKNIFVLIPLIFSRAFWDFDLGIIDQQTILMALGAVVIFCITSSSVYVLNDLMDYKKDRLHPDKKHRPIASGKVSTKTATILWILLVALSLISAWELSMSFFGIILAYLVMTIAYSLYLKSILFIDVILIAVGFVFRVLAGGEAINVLVTDWMIVLVFLFTLFLSIGKRRQELKNLERKAKETRPVLTQYSIDLIDQLNAIVVPIVVTSYIFYTFSERENNLFFVATIPLIVYCFFRYLYLLKNTDFGESASDYLADKLLISVGLIWFVLAMLGLQIS